MGNWKVVKFKLRGVWSQASLFSVDVEASTSTQLMYQQKNVNTIPYDGY